MWCWSCRASNSRRGPIQMLDCPLFSDVQVLEGDGNWCLVKWKPPKSTLDSLGWHLGKELTTEFGSIAAILIGKMPESNTTIPLAQLARACGVTNFVVSCPRLVMSCWLGKFALVCVAKLFQYANNSTPFWRGIWGMRCGNNNGMWAKTINGKIRHVGLKIDYNDMGLHFDHHGLVRPRDCLGNSTNSAVHTLEYWSSLFMQINVIELLFIEIYML